MDDFRVIRFLGAIFTPEMNISNYLKLMNIAGEIIGDQLDGQPTVLPIPQDAPAEIPRIKLASSDERWSLDISLSRTNLFYASPTDLDIEGMSEEEYCQTCSKFFGEYQKKLDLKVQRLGFVTERMLSIENAPEYIINKFCKEEYKQDRRPFNNVNTFEIHSLKKYPWLQFNVNSWVRIKSARYKPINNMPIILVISDINTLSMEEDSEASFQQNDIEKFFEEIPEHLNEILRKYFAQ